MLTDDGIIAKEEDDVYSYFYDKYSWNPDFHIYIRTSPDECFLRTSNRSQEGDAIIDMKYIEKVHHYYEQYIHEKGDNVIIIDGNKSPEEIHTEIVRCISSRDVQV
jgi:thymidylate kinase